MNSSYIIILDETMENVMNVMPDRLLDVFDFCLSLKNISLKLTIWSMVIRG